MVVITNSWKRTLQYYYYVPEDHNSHSQETGTKGSNKYKFHKCSTYKSLWKVSYGPAGLQRNSRGTQLAYQCIDANTSPFAFCVPGEQGCFCLWHLGLGSCISVFSVAVGVGPSPTHQFVSLGLLRPALHPCTQPWSLASSLQEKQSKARSVGDSIDCLAIRGRLMPPMPVLCTTALCITSLTRMPCMTSLAHGACLRLCCNGDMLIAHWHLRTVL